MTQPRLLVNAHEIADEIQDWVSEHVGPGLHWGATPPEVVCASIREHSDRDGLIDYHLLVRILQGAESSKLAAGTNKGLRRFIQRAKEMKVAHE